MVRHFKCFGVLKFDKFVLDVFGFDKFEIDKKGLHGVKQIMMNTNIINGLLLVVARLLKQFSIKK